MTQISPNARNWLKAISAAEGTTRDGRVQYNIMFGGGTFNDLSRHPDTVIDGGRYQSAAAGAYQFMPGTWEGVARSLGLTDFGPVSQDLAALELMRRRGVNPDTAPITAENVALLAPEWASLPTLEGVSYYGQPVKSLSFVQRAGMAPNVMAPAAGSEAQPGPTQPQSQSQPIAAEPQPTVDASDNTFGSSNLQTVLDALGVLGAQVNAGRQGMDAVAERGRKMLDTNPYASEDTEDSADRRAQQALNMRLMQEPQRTLEERLRSGIQMGIDAFRQ